MKIKNLTGQDIYLLDTFEKRIVKIPVEFEFTDEKIMTILLETSNNERFRVNCNSFKPKILKLGQFEPLPPPEKDTVFLVSPNAFENSANDSKEKYRNDFCTYPSLTTLEHNGNPVYKELIFN
ncbi:MAG: hypothetical protein RL621_52 [Bacteroidota bacterium]|jgi:hypothetical protein